MRPWQDTLERVAPLPSQQAGRLMPAINSAAPTSGLEPVHRVQRRVGSPPVCAAPGSRRIPIHLSTIERVQLIGADLNDA